MKILYISSSKIPSSTANSIHVMKMCDAFARLGHDVCLYARNARSSFGSDMTSVYSMYGVSPKFSVRYRPPIVPIAKLVGPTTRVQLEKMCTAIYAVFSAVVARVDLVYTRNLPGALIASFFRCSVVFETHAPEQYRLRLLNSFVRRRLLSPKIKRIVVITRALRTHYVSNYPELQNKVLVAPDSADPIPEHTKPVRLESGTGRLKAGYVGHAYPGKGVELIVQLAQRAPSFEFHIVGATKEEVQRIGHAAAPANLICHGFVSHASVNRYLLAFDVLLLPNQRAVAGSGGPSAGDISKWTSPLKLFEYMAAQKPIIASDVSALREVLCAERNAILCSPEEPKQWVYALVRLQQSEHLRRKIAENAYNLFKMNYTWKARARRVLATS